MFEQKVKNVTNLDERKRDLLKIHRKSFLTGKNAGGRHLSEFKNLRIFSDIYDQLSENNKSNEEQPWR
jgi:hypothetical protein